MYNHKKTKKAQVAVYEKYLRDNTLGPKSNDETEYTKGKKMSTDRTMDGDINQIAEATLPDRKGDEEKITEGQMKDAQTVSDNADAKVIEKLFNETKSYLSVPLRDASTQLTMPPINVLVEKLRQDRHKDFEKDEVKKSNWTLAYDGQNGQLPSKKNTDQVDLKKSVLNNEPTRFDSINADKLVDGKNKSKLTPVTASLNRGDVDHIVDSIKRGYSLDYDAAMLAVLKQADAEKRELTGVEKKTVSNLKIARTRAMLSK